MKVYNRNGTSKLSCNCVTWLNHWKNYANNGSGTKAYKCQISGCDNDAEVGGHVRKSGSSDAKTYILGICRSHNSYSSNVDMEIKDNSRLAFASKVVTCK